MKVSDLAAMALLFILSFSGFNSSFAQNFHQASLYDDYDQGIKTQSGDVEAVPECINLMQVKSSMNYPENAVERGLEGKVTVKVLVGPKGDVIKIGSVSGPVAFHEEVRDKAKEMEFTPVLMNNKPVKVWVTVRFIFRLK